MVTVFKARLSVRCLGETPPINPFASCPPSNCGATYRTIRFTSPLSQDGGVQRTASFDQHVTHAQSPELRTQGEERDPAFAVRQHEYIDPPSSELRDFSRRRSGRRRDERVRITHVGDELRRQRDAEVTVRYDADRLP